MKSLQILVFYSWLYYKPLFCYMEYHMKNMLESVYMYIKVKVQVGAKKEEVKKKNKDSYFVSVREKAERNMANKRVIEIMASLFEISIKNVRIINGHQSPSKILSVNLPENLV